MLTDLPWLRREGYKLEWLLKRDQRPYTLLLEAIVKLVEKWSWCCLKVEKKSCRF